jgi:hypothetical protein
VAGLWYLALILLGPLRLIYIPNTLFVQGDAAATAARIAAHESLFRVGIVTDLVCGVILVLLTLAFYRLFAGVDRRLATLVVILGGVMPALMALVGTAGDLAVLTVIRGAPFLSVFDVAQRDALAMLFLRLRDHLNTSAEILWGVWLFPLGTLVYRSRFLPRVLGVWLLLGGVAYVALCVVGVLWPDYSHTVFTYAQPVFFGEIALTLWLLVRGARPESSPRQA